MKLHLEQSEKRALNIAVIISIIFGAYFLRHYFSIIIVAAIMSYIFHPLRERFMKRFNNGGLSTMLTMFVAFLVFIIPLIFIIIITFFQVDSLVKSIPDIQVSDVTKLGQSLTDFINNMLSHFPGGYSLDLTKIVNGLEDFIKSFGQGFLNALISSISSIPRFFTNIILFIFTFAGLLNSGSKIVELIRKLNPLGEKITNLYLEKMGDMTKAVVKGQFIIAFVQGLIGAASLYIVGWNNVFFFMLLILTTLSIIPLGSGIITIPIGIAMILFGDYWQGFFVLFTHLVIVTNVDNFLRARLVPKSARINSALMMLAVFSGIAMFGFLGIVIGPVIMILILSTIRVYLAVDNDTELKNETLPS